MRIRSEDDFQIMIEELSHQKSIKIYVKEDLNETGQTFNTTAENLEVYDSRPNALPVVI